MLISKSSKYSLPVMTNRCVNTGRQNKLYRPLLIPNPRYIVTPHRTFILGRAIRSILKIRYLLLGGAVSGGMTIQNVSDNNFN